MEWLIILIIGLLLFGNRFPTMMRGLGGSIKEFKRGMEDGVPPREESPTASQTDSKQALKQHES